MGRGTARYYMYRYTLMQHSILIGANGSDSREEGSGLACWPPSLAGEPSLTVSMEDYWSLSRWAFPIENYWIASMEDYWFPGTGGDPLIPRAECFHSLAFTNNA